MQDRGLRPGSGVPEVSPEELRTLLAGRERECWLRLADAVSELAVLHGARAEEIVERIRATLLAEHALQP